MTATVTPHPTLHHVNLKTTRLPEMIDWYGLSDLGPDHQAPAQP